MSMFSKINSFLFPCAGEYEKLGAKKAIALGFQHAFAMSCATILVPLLTGLDVGVALFCAGVGTLIFHLCTGGRMPTFLGSSFAFISAICGVVGNSAFGATKDEQIAAAMGGIIVSGIFYLLLSLVIRIFGKGLIDTLFPPVVRGVGITLIGLNLASTAISNIQTQYGPDGAAMSPFTEGYHMPTYVWAWVIAAVVCLLAVFLSSCGRGMVKMSSIVIALVSGYVLTLILTKTGIAPASLMDTSVIAGYGWLQAPHFVLPVFNITAIGMIAPIAIVTCVEHVGDVYANGAVVGKKFTEKPGLHRTMLGDGLATVFAGFVGGPPNTTYSENTAVLAATGNYNPASLRIAALVAIAVSFFGKGIGVIQSVPNCVLGGACIVLYGMIASVGLRTLVENHVDFTKNRNLCIAAVMLVLAIGGAVIGNATFSFSNIGLGIIVGIILNLVIPNREATGKGMVSHVVKSEEVLPERGDADR
ncbi:MULTISPECIES: uracil-xanthine permease family protein [Eubacteriales]|uniref:uracil-xanthine permease family protein n=1 Tax=Eubacteriales TaxID=186802 RepID=UPI00191C1BB4|nr:MULTISPECIES: uracil-xanthine permease family protein [unclassified Neglectibacter]